MIGESPPAPESAFTLEPGVPYVPSWAEADQAARTLRRELAAFGLVERLPVQPT
jgi:hypothetical protein